MPAVHSVGFGALRVVLEDLHAQTEAYDYLGEVLTYSLDMLPRYHAIIASRQVIISAEAAHLVTVREFALSPPVVWEWLNDPKKRAAWLPTSVEFMPVLRPGGRSGAGARTHCVHGKKVAMIEMVLDWRPFQYFTVSQDSGFFKNQVTTLLTPTPSGGTRLELRERGRLTALPPLDRWIVRLILTRMYPTEKLLAILGEKMEEDKAGR